MEESSSKRSNALFCVNMDLAKMISELRAERTQVEEAIMALERLAQGQGKRRGRPPAWVSAMRIGIEEVPAPDGPKRRGRPPGSKNKPKSE